MVSSFTQISATTPALAPGTVNDVTVTNTDGSAGTLFEGVGRRLPRRTAGSAVLHLRHNARLERDHCRRGWRDVRRRPGDPAAPDGGLPLEGPPRPLLHAAPLHGLLPRRACPSTFADWIKALAAEGITGGCGGGNYCPTNPVRRDQMAVFLLKAEHGSAYLPPPCAGAFSDVPCPHVLADWIEQLVAEEHHRRLRRRQLLPRQHDTRGQMAVFIVKTFSLQ